MSCSPPPHHHSLCTLTVHYTTLRLAGRSPWSWLRFPVVVVSVSQSSHLPDSTHPAVHRFTVCQSYPRRQRPTPITNPYPTVAPLDQHKLLRRCPSHLLIRRRDPSDDTTIDHPPDRRGVRSRSALQTSCRLLISHCLSVDFRLLLRPPAGCRPAVVT